VVYEGSWSVFLAMIGVTGMAVYYSEGLDSLNVLKSGFIAIFYPPPSSASTSLRLGSRRSSSGTIHAIQ
jgi:hypothetical protein